MLKCSIPEFHGKAILLKHIHFVLQLLFLKLTIISCNSIWSTYHVTGNSWIFPESIDRIFFQGRLHLISMENQFSLFGFCTKLKFSIEKLSMQTFPEHQRMSMPCSWSHSSKVVPKILLRFYKLAILILCHIVITMHFRESGAVQSFLLGFENKILYSQKSSKPNEILDLGAIISPEKIICKRDAQIFFLAPNIK